MGIYISLINNFPALKGTNYLSLGEWAKVTIGNFRKLQVIENQ